MTTDDPPSEQRFSLSRWSRRKHEAARAAQQDAAEAGTLPPAAGTAAPVGASVPTVAPAPPVAAPAPEPLPPVESLTPDSDFAPFLQPKVDEATKRAALKKLFTDPRFNVMDGLDVYVDDYAQPDPMPTGMLDKLARVYDAIVGDDEPAATGRRGAPAALADTAEAAPLPAPSAPAASRSADEVAAVSTPLTPALSPQAGRGSDKDASS